MYVFEIIAAVDEVVWETTVEAEMRRSPAKIQPTMDIPQVGTMALAHSFQNVVKDDKFSLYKT